MSKPITRSKTAALAVITPILYAMLLGLVHGLAEQYGIQIDNQQAQLWVETVVAGVPVAAAHIALRLKTIGPTHLRTPPANGQQ